MILIAVVLAIVFLIIIGFFVFAGKKKEEGEQLGERKNF